MTQACARTNHALCCVIGQVLTYDNIRDVIKFCAQEKLVLFADEVYQETMYKEDVTFHSCRKVVKDLGPEYHKFQLMSINSVSKGFYGELVHLIITASWFVLIYLEWPTLVFFFHLLDVFPNIFLERFQNEIPTYRFCFIVSESVLNLTFRFCLRCKSTPIWTTVLLFPVSLGRSFVRHRKGNFSIFWEGRLV